jgi:ribosomal protein S27E
MRINFFMVILIISALTWYVISDGKARRKAQADFKNAGPSLHCMSCGEDLKSPLTGALRGSTLVELALWFTLFGGLIYSIWRRSGKFKTECTACRSNQVVPINSKAAQAHIKTIDKATV